MAVLPLAASTAVAQDGAAIYKSKCAVCHGRRVRAKHLREVMNVRTAGRLYLELLDEYIPNNSTSDKSDSVSESLEQLRELNSDPRCRQSLRGLVHTVALSIALVIYYGLMGTTFNARAVGIRSRAFPTI